MGESLANVCVVLFFTRGVGLSRWDQTGMFERETALYHKMRGCVRGVTFVTYGGREDLSYGEGLAGIHVVCNRWGLPAGLYAAMLSRFYPLCRGPAVFKSNQVPGADVALRAARRSGARFVARCGYLYSDFMGHKHGWDSRQAAQARALERHVFGTADRVVVTTDAMRDSVAERYGLPAERIRVVPNYVQTDIFRPDPALPGSARRLCFVGRLEEQKNLFALLDAIKGLDVELLVIGEGRLRGALEQKVRAEWLPVRPLGNVPHRELPAILNSCAIFLLPSLYEGHPKVLIEAMACGLPVIGTDVPGIRELIRHRQTGYVCGTSAAQLRSAICEVLSDCELAARMGRGARAFVVEHFALERVVKMELELLEELIQ